MRKPIRKANRIWWSKVPRAKPRVLAHCSPEIAPPFTHTRHRPTTTTTTTTHRYDVNVRHAHADCIGSYSVSYTLGGKTTVASVSICCVWIYTNSQVPNASVFTRFLCFPCFKGRENTRDMAFYNKDSSLICRLILQTCLKLQHIALQRILWLVGFRCFCTRVTFPDIFYRNASFECFGHLRGMLQPFSHTGQECKLVLPSTHCTYVYTKCMSMAKTCEGKETRQRANEVFSYKIQRRSFSPPPPNPPPRPTHPPSL